MTLVLSNEEVERLLDVRDCIDDLEDAYREQAAGRAISQLRMDTEVPIERNDQVKEFEFKTMVGILPKRGIAALRCSATIQQWFDSSVPCGRITFGDRAAGLLDCCNYLASRHVSPLRFFQIPISRRFVWPQPALLVPNTWRATIADGWDFWVLAGKRAHMWRRFAPSVRWSRSRSTALTLFIG